MKLGELKIKLGELKIKNYPNFILEVRSVLLLITSKVYTEEFFHRSHAGKKSLKLQVRISGKIQPVTVTVSVSIKLLKHMK